MEKKNKKLDEYKARCRKAEAECAQLEEQLKASNKSLVDFQQAASVEISKRLSAERWNELQAAYVKQKEKATEMKKLCVLANRRIQELEDRTTTLQISSTFDSVVDKDLIDVPAKFSHFLEDLNTVSLNWFMDLEITDDSASMGSVTIEGFQKLLPRKTQKTPGKTSRNLFSLSLLRLSLRRRLSSCTYPKPLLCMH